MRPSPWLKTLSPLRKRLLWGACLSAFIVLLVGITLLIFALGEPTALTLGSSGEYVAKEISLFHLREVASGGDYTYLINGTLHRYEIIPVGERVLHAIGSFLRLDFGIATCMNDGSLLGLVGISSLASLLALCFIVFGAGLSMFSRLLPNLKIPYYLDYILGGFFVVLAFLSPLFSTGVWLPSLFLGLASFCFLLRRANQRISFFLRDAFFVLAALWAALQFLGLYIPVSDSLYPLSSLWIEAVRKGDNHTYSLCFFLMATETAAPLFAGLFCLTLGKRKGTSNA